LAPPRRRALILLLPLAVIIVGNVGRGLYAGSESTAAPRITRQDVTATAKEALRALPTPTPLAVIPDGPDAVEPHSTVYVNGVAMPVSMVFTPDGRMLFSEVTEGTVRVAERDGDQARLLPNPFIKLEIAKGGETGMLGIALDPNYQQNHWVYVYYSEPDPDRKDRRPLRNRIVRFTDVNNVGQDMAVIFDNIQISRQGRHNGGRLLFGPDGKLYATVGNAEDKDNSQNLETPNGKVLRLNPDGSIPSDNPIAGSPIYAYGFRNMFGLTIHPTTHQVYVTENSGDSHDEINLVRPGANYGFPMYEGPGNDPRYVDPIWESGPRTIGPTGATFYTGDQLPQFKNDFFFCAFNTGTLTRMRLGGADFDQVLGAQEVISGCLLDVTNGPDGALYYSSVSQILRLGR
jgi:glucose/arabinose dehydrogenase